MRNILNAVLSVGALVSLAILILIFLQSEFSWARITFGRLLAYPEIRFHRYPSRTAQLGRELFSEDIFAVENRGGRAATEVHLSAIVPFGRISRYELICHEPHTITETHLYEGRLRIWLERLSPGARVTLYTWSATAAESPRTVDFSVTAQEGMAKPTSDLTAAEEIESYTGYIQWMGRRVFHFLENVGWVQRPTSD